MASNEALKLVQAAATSIVDERRRLNEVFEHLRRAVSTFDPSLTLDDNAQIISAAIEQPPEVRVEITRVPEEQMRMRVRAYLKTHGPTRRIDLVEEMDASPAEVESALEQLLGSGSIIHKVRNGDDVVEATNGEQAGHTVEAKDEEPPPAPAELPTVITMAEKMEAVADFLKGRHQPEHYNTLKREYPVWNVRPVLDKLIEQGVVVKDGSGLYSHRDFVRSAPAMEPGGRGSGTRQDVSPGGRRTSTSTPSGESTQSKPDPTQSSEPSAASTESTPPVDSEYGLAQSPKPRSQMKTQSREAEERLDTVVSWAQDQGEEFDPLTARKELGVREPSSVYYMEDGLFGNDSQPASDFRDLSARGVFEATGVEKQPQWKLDSAKPGRNHGMGRGTKFYRFPKAEAHPATKEQGGTQVQAVKEPPLPTPFVTLEQVRDAAVELKNFTLAELILKLGVPNSHYNRVKIREHIATLVLRKMFTDDSDGGVATKWSYVPPPTETEQARKIRQTEARRQAEVAERQVDRALGIPAPTTKLRAARKEVQEIIDAVVRQWGDNAIRRAGNTHFRITPPTGSQISIGGTPNSRGLAVDKKKLRKAGLVLA